MTPDEVFRQLRDIHVPDIAGSGQTGIDPRPMIVFAVVCMAAAILRLWVRRRAVTVRLRGIDPSLPAAMQRDEIVRMVRDDADQINALPVPAAVFHRPPDVATKDIEELRAWARRRLL